VLPGAGILAFNRYIGGVGEVEEKTYRETVLPEWEKQKPLIMWKNDKGEINYMNASYNFPQAAVTGIMQAAFRGESLEDGMKNVAEGIYNEVVVREPS
jgi:hypothetical protein